METNEELSELIGSLGNDGPGPGPEPAPVSELAEPAEPVATEHVTEPEPVVESEPVEPVTTEPTTPEPAEPVASKDELEELKAANAQLLAQLEKLSTPVQPSQPAEPAAPEPEKPLFEMFSAEEILDNPQKFQEFIAELQQRAIRDAVEKAYLRMPEVMQKVVAQQTAVKATSDKFYADNPELASVKQYVARTANELSAANPDWPMNKVLEETAKLCYTNLKIRKGLVQSPGAAPAAPARTPKPGARSASAPKLSGMAADVLELIDSKQ